MDFYAHSKDLQAPEGSNSSLGWIFRILKSGFGEGNWWYSKDGGWYKENVGNPDSPSYNSNSCNDIHIPIQNPHDSDSNGGSGGGLSDNDLETNLKK